MVDDETGFLRPGDDDDDEGAASSDAGRAGNPQASPGLAGDPSFAEWQRGEAESDPVYVAGAGRRGKSRRDARTTANPRGQRRSGTGHRNPPEVDKELSDGLHPGVAVFLTQRRGSGGALTVGMGWGAFSEDFRPSAFQGQSPLRRQH